MPDKILCKCGHMDFEHVWGDGNSGCAYCGCVKFDPACQPVAPEPEQLHAIGGGKHDHIIPELCCCEPTPASKPEPAENPRLLTEEQYRQMLKGRGYPDVCAILDADEKAILEAQDAKSFEAGKASVNLWACIPAECPHVVKIPTIEEIASEIACGIDRVAAKSWKYTDIAKCIQALMGQESKHV